MSNRSDLLTRFFPFLIWWPLLDRKTVKGDLMAGLTGAVVVLPQGVAFATIAGMPPEYGLYAGMVPAIVAALFGSSWHLVSGPTTAASIVLLGSLSAFAEPMTPEYVQLAFTLTFMVGVIELTLGLARMGTLVNFISHSVVIGFTAGAALLIAVNQIKNSGKPVLGHVLDKFKPLDIDEIVFIVGQAHIAARCKNVIEFAYALYRSRIAKTRDILIIHIGVAPVVISIGNLGNIVIREFTRAAVDQVSHSKDHKTAPEARVKQPLPRIVVRKVKHPATVEIAVHHVKCEPHRHHRERHPPLAVAHAQGIEKGPVEVMALPHQQKGQRRERQRAARAARDGRVNKAAHDLRVKDLQANAAK